MSSAKAEVLVIVNAANPIQQLSRDELINIYMGRSNRFSAERMAIPFDLLPDSIAREEFYRALVGKSVAQVNAYWARLLFTGASTPPQVLHNPQMMLKMVSENRDAIGYIDSSDKPEKSVKVVYRLEAHAD